MKILKAFIVAAVIECSVLNQERYRRQIDWNFVDSNSDENIEGIGEIFRIQKYIASVYVSDRYARTELALNVKNIDLVNSRFPQNDLVPRKNLLYWKNLLFVSSNFNRNWHSIVSILNSARPSTKS